MKLKISSLLAISVILLSGCTGVLGGSSGQSERDTNSWTELPNENSDLDSDTGTTSASSGADFMAMALDDLNTYDTNGMWFEDPYSDASGLSVGVLLDEYSVAPEGCALWWYDSESDLNAHLETSSEFFDSFYWQSWIYDAGPAVLLATNGPEDACYFSAVMILELEP